MTSVNALFYVIVYCKKRTEISLGLEQVMLVVVVVAWQVYRSQLADGFRFEEASVSIATMYVEQ